MSSGDAGAAEAASEAPREVQVPGDSLGLIIGRGGSAIKRLIESTGCQVEVPRDEVAAASRKRPRDGEEAPVTVQLQGSQQQRRAAAVAIADLLKGGDVEDHAVKAEGGMVVPHNLEGYDRQQWLGWRLVPSEKELFMRTEVGRKTVRVFAEAGRKLNSQTAQMALERVQAAIELARELVELAVDALPEHEPENADYDPAIGPFIDQYGVLVRVPRPENGVVSIRIIGPQDPARDVAALLEARYKNGRHTASVMQVLGQVQSMEGQMKGDFQNDLTSLCSDFRVEIQQSKYMLWITGGNAEQVQEARTTLQEMLQFYFPEHFFRLHSLKKGAVEALAADPELRGLCAKGDIVLAYDRKGGSVWICGTNREAVKKRINAVMEKYEAEHFELDLEDYGAAMWLLGPQGSGAYLAKMQNESGAKLQVSPVQLKVWCEGKPRQVAQARKLVLQALEQLAAKKAGPGPTPKVKELLTEPPPHMKAIMEKLAKLEAEKIARMQAEKWGVAYQPPPDSALSGRHPAEALLDQPPAAATSAQRVLEWDPASGQMVETSVELESRIGVAEATAAATEAGDLPAQGRNVRPRVVLAD